MYNPLEITCYFRTGYNPSDEPASDLVVNQNEQWVAPETILEQPPYKNLQVIKINIDDERLKFVDYIKLRDTITNEQWYFYVSGHTRENARAVSMGIVYDAFATVGLDNITFFGNVMRRTLSQTEKQNYPLLPEPWAPRRPLKTRRIIIDLNVNKTIRMPSHISQSFESTTTPIQAQATINVPNSPLGASTFQDGLSISTSLPMIYPQPATSASHNITTPWGTINYSTPYEQYMTLSGTTLATFLANAKKTNSLDLIDPPYYLPSPGSDRTITLDELNVQGGENPKASRFYTTVTIASLAGHSSRTFSDNDTNLQYIQQLSVIIDPGKNGGIYVLPTTIRDTGLSAYTYLEGVYSPFETVLYNATGDTPAKYAADRTITLNTALNGLYKAYTDKINAIQYERAQANYFKDVGLVKGTIMSFVADIIGGTQTTEQTTEYFDSNGNKVNKLTSTNRSSSYTADPLSPTWIRYPYSSDERYATTYQKGSYWFKDKDGVLDYTKQANRTDGISTTEQDLYTTKTTMETSVEGVSQSVGQSNQIATDNIGTIYNSTVSGYGGSISWNTLQTILFGSYRNEMHSTMLGNINDYLNRWVSIQNDIANGNVSNLFKNVTLVGDANENNKLVGKYEIIVASLQPEDEMNFNLFLDHFGHAVDEYTDALVSDAGNYYNYTMVGEDAILANSIDQGSSYAILNQFRTGVRVWKVPVRPENY